MSGVPPQQPPDWDYSTSSTTGMPPGQPGPVFTPETANAYYRGGAQTGHAPPRQSGFQQWLKGLGPVGAVLLALLKYGALALKFALPVLKTGGTMLLSIWVYSVMFGWWFAVGFVLCIFVHEMGHVFMAWRMGVPVTAPIFIPGMGALILQKRWARSAWDEALIGIGGPLGGTLAAIACYAVGLSTGNGLMIALAHIGAFLNLFNLAPIFPLDGGWITGAISPRIWLIGMVAMGALFVTGHLQNPLLILLLIVSLPRMWHGLKTGEMIPGGGTPVQPAQRLTMGIAYVGLAAFLLWLMGATQAPSPVRPTPVAAPVQSAAR